MRNEKPRQIRNVQELRGAEMSEMGDDFRAFRAFSQEKRKKNTEKSTVLLSQAGIEFVSKNNGTHLIVGEWNYWPGTGLFIHKTNGKRGRGIFKLIEVVRRGLRPEGQ